MDQELTARIDEVCRKLGITLNDYKEIARASIETTRKHLAEFDAALKTRDVSAMRKIIYKMRGTYLTLGIREISSAVDAMANAVKDGRDQEKIAEFLKIFEDHFHQFEGHMFIV